MKRTIMAFIAGAVLATAGSVYAEDIKTLIGKQIEGEIPVKVNGETLEKKAIFVDGTSYLPVRAIGDALNMNVGYDADLGVELTPKDGAKLSTETTPETPVEPKQMSQEDIETLESLEREYAKSKEKNAKLKNDVADSEEKIKILDEQIAQETDATKKGKLEFDKNYLLNGLNASKSILEMGLESELKYEEAINKIKAKYE